MGAWCGTKGSRGIMGGIMVDLIVIAVLALPYILFVSIPPFERIVWRDDRSLMYPFTEHEIIPTWAVPFFAFLLPMVLLSGWLGLQRFRNRRLLVAYVGLALSLLISTQITSLIKPLAGRPRPDFLARCNPDPENIKELVCRGNPKLIADGRRSFPSGHTSASFAGLAYAGFFLAGQMAAFDGKGRVYRLLVSLVPFLVASYVGITRIMDYRHHWQDVLAGALLGTGAAYLSYRLYFPSVSDRESYLLLEEKHGCTGGGDSDGDGGGGTTRKDPTTAGQQHDSAPDAGPSSDHYYSPDAEEARGLEAV